MTYGLMHRQDKSEKHNVEQQKKQDPEVWFPLHRIQKQSKLKSIL